MKLVAIDITKSCHDVLIELPVPMRRRRFRVGCATLYIEPGSPWESGCCESFNGKQRDECLNGEIFYSLREAQIVIEQWRVDYKTPAPFRARLSSACARGNQASRKLDFRGSKCNVNSLTPLGTKSRSAQYSRSASCTKTYGLRAAANPLRSTAPLPRLTA